MTARKMVNAFYDYHRWANERLLDAAAKVDEAELLGEADIPFGCVQDNMLHILGSQVSWIMRLTGAPPHLPRLSLAKSFRRSGSRSLGPTTLSPATSIRSAMTILNA